MVLGGGGWGRWGWGEEEGGGGPVRGLSAAAAAKEKGAWAEGLKRGAGLLELRAGTKVAAEARRAATAGEKVTAKE